MQGIALWAKAVLPVLFPFLVLTGLLTKLGAAQKLADRLSPLTKKIGLPGCAAYCLLVSLLSGYPVGSRTVADLYRGGAVTREEARRMSVLCSTSGPMFLVGSVGGAMFRSAAAGRGLARRAPACGHRRISRTVLCKAAKRAKNTCCTEKTSVFRCSEKSCHFPTRRKIPCRPTH